MNTLQHNGNGFPEVFARNMDEFGRQWLRACSITLADSGGQGLDLAALRVTFTTRKGDAETPNTADIRIYNLSPATANRIEKEFTRVVLEAGYQSNSGVIFDGSIRQVRRGRDGGTDSWLEIQAADGDQAYNWATVNSTLAAGSAPADRVSECERSFAGKKTRSGYAADLGNDKLPRGKIMYGAAKQYMRGVTDTTDSSWNFQDGQLNLVKNDAYLPGEAVVLTHETGLIGTPEQTNEGVSLRCLLNPKLKINGRIKLDNKSVQKARSDVRDSAKRAPGMDNDGIYRILSVEFSGDTRGNDWHASITCVALDGTSGTPQDIAG